MQFQNLYVHTPFCETKCHYCDFFSLPEAKSSEATQARVYSALLSELNLYDLTAPQQTLFFGGGTPSLAPLSFFEKFFSKIKLAENAEVTLESNPSSVTLEKTRAWRERGINRISLGVQALTDERLEWLGRVHSKNAAFTALDAVHQAGFERISTDYIVGVPGQTTALIEKELRELFERFPKIRHVSAYLLTLKPSNPRFKELPDEDTQLAHLRTVRDVLGAHGLQQYEISNFAAPGFEARHNENYWLGGSYLGIGPSAHSFDAHHQRRWKNWASLGPYCEMAEKEERPIEWQESVDAEQQRLEYLMLRLRRRDGILLKDYSEKFGRNLINDNTRRMESWESSGWITRSETGIRLKGDGFFLSDSIVNSIT